MSKLFKLTSLIFLFILTQNLFAAENEDCSASGGFRYICGLEGFPEDIVTVPGTEWAIAVSLIDEDPEGLNLVNINTKSVSVLYSSASSRNRHNRNLYGMCPGAPDEDNFQTHGLSIRAQAGSDEVFNLYTVSHGTREAIDVFELDVSDTDPEITWVGCVLMPDGLDANDVAAMRDGSILATVVRHPGFTFADMLAGELTGGVYKWVPGDAGFTMLEGSALPGNNGIEVSADETEIFVASPGARAIYAIANSNPTRVLRRTRTLEFGPDNVVLGDNGYLTTGGMVDNPMCEGGNPLDGCPRGSGAVSIHPETMRDTTLIDLPGNPDFAGATMALITSGNEVWLGSFAHRKIAYRVVE